jgi:hypothetical protein
MPRFRTSQVVEGEQCRKERQEKDQFFDLHFSKEEIDNRARVAALFTQRPTRAVALEWRRA